MIQPIDVQRTAEFDRWLKKLKDSKAKARILVRIKRIELGNLGDEKSLGGGVRELRFDFGPGYRVYYLRQGDRIVLLLSGGDKGSQLRDSRAAKDMAAQLKRKDR